MSTDTQNNQNLIERLFKAGAHFGFSRSRRHPTVKPYLFGSKQGTDIFDLEKTAVLLENAKQILAEAGENGKTVLFVGTKDETSSAVEKFAKDAEAPYVVNRWIGGMITNWGEIKKRVARLHELINEGESGELERKYTKKERVIIGREADKLTFNFGGIKDIEKTPDLLLIVDPKHESIAVEEAKELGLPIIGVMSSDNNLNDVTYPVLLNDALQASVNLALEELTTAYKTGKSKYVPKPTKTEGRNRRFTPRRA